jgi:hypothetical protein
MPRRDRVVPHPVVRAQVVDAFADSLGVPFLVGDLGVPGGVGHPVVDRRRLLDELLGYRSHPGHQRVACSRPFGRTAQPGQLSLLQLPDVEHALDVRQPGLGPGRAGERLARGAVARAAVEYSPPVPRRPARRLLQQGAPGSRCRAAGCTTISRPPWSRFSLAGRSSRHQPTAWPWSVASHTSLGQPSQPTVIQPVNGCSVNDGSPG